MAKYWDPSNDEFNPYNEDSPVSPKSQDAAAPQNDSSSKDLLRNSENSALSKTSLSFRYSGKGKSASQGKGKNKFSGRKKGLTALILSLCIMGGGAAFLGSSNSLLMPAIQNIFPSIAEYDHASHSTRVDKIISSMSSGQKASYTWNKAYYNMSNWLKGRFTDNGINVDGNNLSYDGKNISGNNFIEASNNNLAVRDATNKATYGNVINDFDDVANNNYELLTGNNRNVFKDYKTTGDAEADAANFKQTSLDYYEGKSSTTITSNAYEEEKVETTNDKGEKVTETTARDALTTKSDSVVADKNQAITQATETITALSQKVGRIANYGCTALMLGTSIVSAITGLRMMNSFNKGVFFMEPGSKTMYGDGDSSGINTQLNQITSVQTVTVDDPTKVIQSGSVPDATTENKAEGDLTIDIGTTEMTGSMLDSPNFRAALSQATYSPAVAAIFSMEASAKTLLSTLKTLGVIATTCTVIQAGLAAVDILTPIVMIGVTIASGGTLTLASAVFTPAKKLLEKAILSVIGGIVVNFAISGVYQFAVKMLADELTNQAESPLGIPGGEEAFAAVNTVSSMNSRRNSGLALGNEEQVTQYSKVYNDVLAKDAELDRYNRSPFDTSSKNTFLGSIAYSLLPLQTSRNLSVVSSVMQTTSASLASLTSNTYAADGTSPAQTQYMNQFGDCPNLESIGAKGDIYCNPIMISSVDTLNLDPNDSTYASVIDSNLECQGDNCSIKADGNLARYVAFCVERTSPFGVIDASISQQLQEGNAIINAVPYVGDIAQIMDAVNIEHNNAWADGTMCGGSSPLWDSEIKYYQRYVEDQRILDQLHAYDDTSTSNGQNPVTAFREQYRAEHPLDNSDTGYLARVSGISKDDAELLLDVVAYYNFIENYDASTRIAMDGDTTSLKSGEEVAIELQSNKLHIESEESSEKVILATQHVIYADVRNRSYAV